MNIKTFTIIAIASFAVLSVTACGGKQKASIETEQTEETSKTEVIVHIPADTRSAFPVISVQSPVSIQCCWQS